MAFDDIPKIHPRERIVQKASGEIGLVIAELSKKHQLTWGEQIRILGAYLSSMAKYMIRDERHPNDPEKPGGLE